MNDQGFQCRQPVVGRIGHLGDGELENGWVWVWACREHAGGHILNEYPRRGIMCEACRGSGNTWKRVRDSSPSCGSGKKPTTQGGRYELENK